MSHDAESTLASWLGRWVAFCVRHWPWVLLLTFASTVGLGVYVARNLGIQTDLDNMLDPELPFRKARAAYARAFPQFESQLVLVIEAQTPEDARSAALALAGALRERTDVFAFPTVPRADPFLEEKGLYYLDEEALLDLSDQLARVQPFLGRLTRDPSLRGLLDMLERALEEAEKGGDYDVSPLVIRLDRAIDAALSGRSYRLSWQELMAEDEPTPDERRQYVLVQVRKDDEALFSTGEGIHLARGLFEETTRSLPGAPRMRITGSIAMEHEELQTVRRGAEWIGLVTLVLVALTLVLGLRSGRLVWASLLTLVVGLVFTAAFATLAVGHLNLISVAFGVLYIGLGVDYAIHLGLRYREALLAGGRLPGGALVEATRDVGTSLVLCTFTTAIGFYAFVPTAYKGVSELGLISGTGMFVSLFVSLTFLPALLAALGLTSGRFRPAPPPRGVLAFLVDLPVRHRRGVLLAGLGIGLAALTLLPQARFDLNPLNLRDPESESVETFRELVDTSDTPPWSIKILAPGPEAAAKTAASLEKLDAVDKVVTISSFVPSGQAEKQFVLDDLLLALGPGLLQIEPVAPPTRGEVVEAVGTLATRAAHYLSTPAGADDASVASLVPRLASLAQALRGPDAAALVGALEHGLLDTLPSTLGRLDRALQAQPFTQEDLPSALRRDWVGPDGTLRLEVFPRENLDDIPALRRFTSQVQARVPHATGAPVTIVASGHAIVGAFQQALLVSIVACFLILWLLLRRLRDVFLVLVPLLFAAVVTCASTVLLASPFNFANVIAIPLLFGIGVDSGIHVVHRARGRLPASAGGNPIRTSTGRAVVFSALTTVCSFGSLAFSPHPGTASMGLLLAVGVTATVLATLWLLPALAGRRDGRVTG